MRITLVVLGICLGGALASFGSLVLSRTPHGRSILRPSSYCDACRRTLRPLENVPIFGYLSLGGTCRTCRATIPPVTIALELLGALAGGLIVYALTA